MTVFATISASSLRRENATATMEFVITFPIIMILFIAVFETSMIMTRQVMMERTLDQAVRILRLANGLTVTPPTSARRSATTPRSCPTATRF
jgi:Flp pilus assembly protein TadG